MQQINLYQPTAKGPKSALSSTTVVRVLLLLVLTLAGLWGFGTWQVSRLRAGVETVRIQQQAQASLEAAGVAELESLSQEQLEQHVAQLSSALDVKNRALELLQSEGEKNQSGFSARLEGLARQHVDGIWLDNVTLGGSTNALSVSGTTLNPTLVPQYLRALSSDAALRGAQIDDFIIEQVPAKNATVSAIGLRFRASNQDLAPKVVTQSEEQT
jgi:hypothetical protein